MGQLVISSGTGTITSKELVEQINLFRSGIEGKAELQHKTLLEIIRDEFEEEIDRQEILPITSRDSYGREQPMFTLTISQAKQVLVRESKLVRKAVIKLLEELENKSAIQTPQSYGEALLAHAQTVVEKERIEAQLLITEAVVLEKQAEVEKKTKSVRKNVAKTGGLTNSRNLKQKKLEDVCASRNVPTPEEWEFHQREAKHLERENKALRNRVNILEAE